jgi:CHAT domain-containing protein/cytochrome c-type biogenesis protein CcmH/NrfG
LERPGTQHLDEGEFEQLLGLSHPTGYFDRVESPPRELEAARNHLDRCRECEQNLNMYRAAQNELNGIKFARSGPPPGECVEDSQWPLVVAGGLSDEECQRHLAHASQCDRCGPALRDAVRDLQEPPTPEEETFLAELETRSSNWSAPKRESEHKGAAGSHERRGRSIFFGSPTLIFATLLVAVGIVVVAVRFRQHEESIEQLVAQAYAEDRTMEFRIPGAEPGTLHRERGPRGSILNRSKALILAVQAIQDRLSTKPNDPALLDAKARVEMLDGQPEDAIETLERASESDPDSTAIMTDTATAFLLRAENTHSGQDVAKAEDLFIQVLKRAPDNTTALFNLSIAEENQHLYAEALNNWNLFFQYEKDDKWRKEGEAHRDAIRQQNHSMTPRPRTGSVDAPSTALAEIRARPSGAPERDIDALRDEVFLTDALIDWLPKLAAARRVSKPDAAGAAEAVKALADTLQEKHHDPFLADLMSTLDSPQWPDAIDELAAAMRANSQGNMPEIVSHAHRSGELFRKAGNPAGESAAAFEYLSGVNRLLSADQCPSAAASGLGTPGVQGYSWVESNLLFETSTCDFMIGKQEAALENARRATQVAVRSRYKILELQGAYFLDGVSTPWVATTDSWNRIQASLDEFWRYSYPVPAGEGFYIDLGYAAQAEGLWHCAEGVFRESVEIHSADEDFATRAAAHHLLAKAAEAAGDAEVAEVEYRRANALLANLGNGPAQLRLAFEIDRAVNEVNRNDLKAAAVTLGEIEPHLSEISNHYARFPYFAALGRLQFLSGQTKLAEKELLNAIRLIEQDKQTLVSETDLLSWSRDTAPAYRSLLELYLTQPRQEARTFSFLEWYRGGPLRRLRPVSPGAVGPASPPYPAQLAAFRPERLGFDSDRGLLTWISLPGTLTIFYLDKDGLHTATDRIRSDELASVARRLLRLCADPSSDREALNRDSRQLYDWLIQPVAPYVERANVLIIEPDDSFGPIPFQALMTPGGRYLGDMFSIIESPGIAYSRIRHANSPISARSEALVVGEPFLQGSWSGRFLPLPEAFREASDIAASFDHRHLLTGRDATERSILTLLPQMEIFHFAGHALAQRNETGLVVAPAGDTGQLPLLAPERLSQTSLKRLKLVTLSGCETGVADQGLVDPQSLVRVFLYAGVPNVVASKWRVDSETSAILMTSVYRHLLGGEPVDKAMALVERQLRSSPHTAHPYYWAAFSVFGS